MERKTDRSDAGQVMKGEEAGVMEEGGIRLISYETKAESDTESSS